jgi:hypothetical protein
MDYLTDMFGRRHEYRPDIVLAKRTEPARIRAEAMLEGTRLSGMIQEQIAQMREEGATGRTEMTNEARRRLERMVQRAENRRNAARISGQIEMNDARISGARGLAGVMQNFGIENYGYAGLLNDNDNSGVPNPAALEAALDRASNNAPAPNPVIATPTGGYDRSVWSQQAKEMYPEEEEEEEDVNDVN